MSIRISRPDIEDFWDDCIKFEPPKNIKNDNKNKSKNNMVKSKSTLNINSVNNNAQKKNNNFKKNHKLLDKILRTEESNKINLEKNKQKQIDKLTTLYNKDMTDKKRVEKEINNLKEKLKKNELDDCTFKPKKNRTKNKSYDIEYVKHFGQKDIYQRGKIYKRIYKRRLNELKKEVEEEQLEFYPFKPEIKEKNINRVLYGRNYWEDQANNLSNKFFLWRYMKARKDESDKKKRLIWRMDNNDEEDYDENKNVYNPNNHKVVHRSISQKDSLLYKKSLHNSLLSFQTNDNNENIMIK